MNTFKTGNVIIPVVIFTHFHKVELKIFARFYIIMLIVYLKLYLFFFESW